MTHWSKTEQFAATVEFAEGMTLHGNLHLQPAAAHHSGAETPLDMLNRPDRFYPLTLPSGEVALVAKAQTAVVACARQPAVVDEERLSIARATRLVVRMAGGSEYRGTAMHESPPTHARALDFLNTPDQFFAITDDATTWYINRAYVLFAHPHD